jgi:formylglycine-generating enzyme required for sulfatase activity
MTLEKDAKSSGGGKWFFGLIILLAVLALGWYGTQGTNNPAISTTQKTITNSIGMGFVLIPAGEFDMGSPANEAGRQDNEGPVHHVKIPSEFYLGKYEVTQKQWRDVMGSSPSNFKGDNLPVESVSWNDVQDFIKKLNEKEGGNKYRLPSEAEWEYAVRAGTATRYFIGDNESNLDEYEWFINNSNYRTNPVGQKKPNPWGMYDMYGNVFEWVQDKGHSDYNGAPTDGSAWESGDGYYRIIRGSMYLDGPKGLRSAYRSKIPNGDAPNNVGFRLVRDI